MLSCGETTFASHKEVEEFFALARTLGRHNEQEEDDERRGTALGEPQQQDHLHQDEQEEELTQQDQEKLVFQQHQDEQQYHQEEEEISNSVEVKEEVNQSQEESHGVLNNKEGQHQIIEKSPVDYEKEIKYQKLRTIIADGVNVYSCTYPCPIFGCPAKYKTISQVLYHLTRIHFMVQLRERRTAELAEATRGRKITCTICGSGNIIRSPRNLISHYGIIHKDLANVALDQVLHDVQRRKENVMKGQEVHQQHCKDQDKISKAGETAALDDQARKEQKLVRLRELCSYGGKGQHFSCFLCKMNTRKFTVFLQHVTKVHFRRHICRRNGLGDDGVVSDAKGKDLDLECSECKARLKTRQSLILHCGIVHGHTWAPLFS